MPDSSPFVALRQRVITRVTRDFFVRWHMTLIFTGVVLSGVVASKLLLVAGLRSMALRYTVAVICSYLVFFLLVRLWLAYIARAGLLAVDAERVRFGGRGASGAFQDAGPPGASGTTIAAVSSPGLARDRRSHGVAPDLSPGGDLSEGVAALILFLLLVTAIGGVGVYLVVQAPEILAEAAFQMVFAAALTTGSRRLDFLGWSGSVFRATWGAFLLVLVLAGAFGWLAQHHCPWAARMGQVFFGCLLEP